MGIQTYFAIAEKYSEKELQKQIGLVSGDPVLSGLLNTVNGILAVVNDRRQVLAVNDSFMLMLGLDSDYQVEMGLRPGEILRCVYADNEPGGCGTARSCRSCGAAIAMVTTLAENKPVEQKCVLRSRRGASEVDLAFNVCAQPIEIDKRKFLLLFLQDITRIQHLAALERSFFHDINNLMSVLVGASELLAVNQNSPLARTVHQTALRLQDELSIQRYIAQDEEATYSPLWSITTAGEIFDEIGSLFANHPAARNKALAIDTRHNTLRLRTDTSLLLRILNNMLLNAFESTPEGKEVRLWLEEGDTWVSFHVWNPTPIPEDLQPRIFQRNFSTKEEEGRGVGTFSMRLLGEKILGGRVSFSSTEEEGTTFCLTLGSEARSRA